MAIVSSPVFLDHSSETEHPENPLRLSVLYEGLDKHPIFSRRVITGWKSVENEDLVRAHGKQMIQQMLSFRGRNGWIDGDTYYNKKSIDVALAASGACVSLAEKIWKKEVRRGFALIRPPGHHATPDRSMGFCLFNNVGLATQAIRSIAPQSRLAIVDFDLHHGNGTQDLFYEDPNVLFISSHRFPFYPGSGDFGELGKGKGLGTTLNFPLDERYPGNFFVGLYQRVISPVLRQFGPDMIIVSAGFDGHERDPMGGFAISTQSFQELGRVLVSDAERMGGRILFCLEGGYHPEATRDSVMGILEVMENQGKTPLEVEVALEPTLESQLDKIASELPEPFAKI